MTHTPGYLRTPHDTCSNSLRAMGRRVIVFHSHEQLLDTDRVEPLLLTKTALWQERKRMVDRIKERSIYRYCLPIIGGGSRCFGGVETCTGWMFQPGPSVIGCWCQSALEPHPGSTVKKMSRWPFFRSPFVLLLTRICFSLSSFAHTKLPQQYFFSFPSSLLFFFYFFIFFNAPHLLPLPFSILPSPSYYYYPLTPTLLLLLSSYHYPSLTTHAPCKSPLHTFSLQPLTHSTLAHSTLTQTTLAHSTLLQPPLQPPLHPHSFLTPLIQILQ